MADTKKKPVQAVAYALACRSLGSMANIRLTLEDQTVRIFEVAAELRISEDGTRVARAARRAPGQVAFWKWQEARLLRDVRIGEIELAEVEANAATNARYVIDEKTDFNVTEPMVRAVVDGMHPDIKEKRLALEDLRLLYRQVQSLAAAVEHRCYILRKLLQHDPDGA